MLVTLGPALAAALVASVPFLETVRTAPAGSGQATAPEVHARAARALLEPRGNAAPPRLRQVSVRGQPVDFGQGSLEAASPAGPSRPFLLRHTDVAAEVTGFVSSVTVTQEFENPFSEPVEAVYVFPLPDDAAVDEMTLAAGPRVLRATIQKREDARRQYEEAKHQGRRAALLDQERPNIFTQSVANLLPGEVVKVTLHYVAPLRYDDGVYTLNFPMVVGPRYVPGSPLAGEPQGTGTQPDTDRVLDASRISPPAERTGRDIAVSVRLDAGSAILNLASVSHRLWAERLSPRQAVVALDSTDRIPNKDFILRWRVSGPEKRAALLATGGRGGTFALLVTPESADASQAIAARELVFVLDTSCSMTGAPLAAEKRAVRSALEQLNPDDTFRVIDFADSASSLHATSLANTPANVKRALAYLDALPASGGTNQLAGIRAALSPPAERERLRLVLFLTDGFIGNDAEVLSATERELGAARLFAFGVGTSVNHSLLARLAEVGRGFYQYVRPDEDPEPAIERFVRRIERPLLTDVEVDWGGLAVAEVLPNKVPDLFDAQPLALIGKVREPGHGIVTVRGRQAGRPVELKLEVTLPEAPGGAPGLPAVWARARIEQLDRLQYGGDRGDVIRQITSLGLEHHLVTAYTSLVAVEETPVTAAGGQRTVVVPTEVPDLTEGVDGKDEGFGGIGSNQRPAPQLLGMNKRKASTINFSDDTIEGSLARPDAAFIDGRKKVKFDSLIKVRENFEDKVLDRAPGSLGGGATRSSGEVQVQGSLAPSGVRATVQIHLREVSACYQRALLTHPGLAGKLVVEISIGADGRVKRARVKSSTLTDAAVEACVLRQIEAWRFPAPVGGGEVVVVYPFLFTPQP